MNLNIFIFFLLLASNLVHSQSSKDKELDTLFTLTRVDESIEAESLYVTELFNEIIAHPPDVAIISALNKRYFVQLQSIVNENMNHDIIRASITSVYADAFTLKELLDINTFYRSPVGKKLSDNHELLGEGASKILEGHFSQVISIMQSKLALKQKRYE